MWFRRTMRAVGNRLVLVAGLSLLALTNSLYPGPVEAGELGQGDLRISNAGRVLGAGDVNGDGKADVLVSEGAQTRVLFAPLPEQGRIDFRSINSNGFLIQAPKGVRSQAAPGGDINGDGMHDILVGAPYVDVDGEEDAGMAYVVFGKASSSTVDLRTFEGQEQNEQGFRIVGSRGRVGADTAGLGDLNDDGYDDIAVFADWYARTQPLLYGRIYVIFGQAAGGDLALETFDTGTQLTRGYVIDTPLPYGSPEHDLDGAGDVNGDGTPDIVLGVLRYINAQGSAYVIFGKVDPSPQRIMDPGPWGFRIRGDRNGDGTGVSVAGAADVNGDGLSDVIIGASAGYRRGGTGRAAVIFGKPDMNDVRLRNLGRAGFWITGGRNDLTGMGVGAAGDVNGDGLADLLVGAPLHDNGDRKEAGAAYLVYGRDAPYSVDLSKRTPKAVRFLGPLEGRRVGYCVDGLGDVTGDGASDLGIGTGRVLFNDISRPLVFITPVD